MFNQPQKITAEERNLAISKYVLLLESINSGAWEYSPSKLKADLDAFKTTTWVQVHPLLAIIIFFIAFLLGVIPAIGFVATLLISKPGRERYEVAVLKLKNESFLKKQ